MKGPTIEEVRELQKETGEGMIACKKILAQKYAKEEKDEMLSKVSDLSFIDRKSERLMKDILIYLIKRG